MFHLRNSPSANRYLSTVSHPSGHGVASPYPALPSPVRGRGSSPSPTPVGPPRVSEAVLPSPQLGWGVTSGPWTRVSPGGWKGSVPPGRGSLYPPYPLLFPDGGGPSESSPSSPPYTFLRCRHSSLCLLLPRDSTPLGVPHPAPPVPGWRRGRGDRGTETEREGGGGRGVRMGEEWGGGGRDGDSESGCTYTSFSPALVPRPWEGSWTGPCQREGEWRRTRHLFRRETTPTRSVRLGCPRDRSADPPRC